MPILPTTAACTPWDGAMLADGAQVTFRSTLSSCREAQDADYGMKPYQGWLHLVPYRFNDLVPQYDYVVADEEHLPEVFTVTTWPRGAGESVQYCHEYQKVILRASTGKYLTREQGGNYVASATQDQASVLLMDLRPEKNTQFFDAGYRYDQRSAMERDLQTVRFATAQCTKTNGLRMMFWNYQYGGQNYDSVLDVFMQTVIPVHTMRRF